MHATTPKVAAYFSADSKVRVIQHNLHNKLIHDVVKTVELAREISPPVTNGCFKYGNKNILFSAEELEAIWSVHHIGHQNCLCNKSDCEDGS